MARKNILLVEDEVNLASVIALNLRIEGYQVEICDNGLLAVELIKKNPPDLVVLDIMLPELNGVEVCKQIKKLNSDIPILFLSAKSSGAEKIEGLKAGGDDYLTKPFNLEELILRVQNLFKRFPVQQKEDLFSFAGFIINFNDFTVTESGVKKHLLTNREIKLLKMLVSKQGIVVSREEIIQQLWNSSENPSSRTIDNYILNFRKIFEKQDGQTKYFYSIRGVGYKFVIDLK